MPCLHACQGQGSTFDLDTYREMWLSIELKACRTVSLQNALFHILHAQHSASKHICLEALKVK